MTADTGHSIQRACPVQVSQSELDLEKFAASILLDEGPPPTGEDLGQARASDSSLQGSNSEWEAMLVENLSAATSVTGSAPEHASACGTALPCTQGVHALSALSCATSGDGTPDNHRCAVAKLCMLLLWECQRSLSKGKSWSAGALAQQAGAVHPQAGVELPGSTQPLFPLGQSINPFDKCLGASAFQAAARGLKLGAGFPSPLDEPTLGTGQFKQAGSASTLQSSITGTAFGSEPATPTGVPPFAD